MPDVCLACGRPLGPGRIGFCTSMCESSSRDVFGPEGAIYFDDPDEFVSEAEREEARRSLAKIEEYESESVAAPEVDDEFDDELDEEMDEFDEQDEFDD